MNHQNQSPNRGSPGPCFRCNKLGHWTRTCPESPATRGSPISTPPRVTSDSEFSSTHCPCGEGLCLIKVSQSQNNPGRKYYKCPGLGKGNDCGHFKWCDELREQQRRVVQPEHIPTCGCGAGTCKVLVEDRGPNAGRRYYGCYIPKGEGACNYKQWVDNIPIQNSLQDELILSHEDVMQIDALEMGAHTQPQDDVLIHMKVSENEDAPDRADEAIAGYSGVPASSIMNHTTEIGKHIDGPGAFTCEEPIEVVPINMEDGDQDDGANEKRGDTVVPLPFVQDSVSELITDSDLTDQNGVILKDRGNDAIDSFQTSVPAFLKTLGNSASQNILLKYLMAYQLQDSSWQGQFGCHSPKCITTISALDSFLNGTFPGLLSKDFSTGHYAVLDDKLREGSPLSRLGVINDGPEACSVMKGTILQSFEELAHRFMNDLITLLESIAPLNHEMMLKEAECTFFALDRLLVDYSLFQLRVSKYIEQAVALAKLEETVSSEESSQEIVNRYYEEKTRVEEISKAYSQAKAAFMDSGEQLRVLRQNASCAGNLLCEMKSKLSYCEKENAALRQKLLEIANAMSVSKETLRAVSVEAEDVIKQNERMEIQLTAAKAAFEIARAQLRK